MLTEKLQNIPKSSGCYLFKDKKGQIIYVGKAKYLPNRVKSYFSNKNHSDKTKLLVENVSDVDFLTTLDENSALTLENDLIKSHKPKFNIKLKDDTEYETAEKPEDDEDYEEMKSDKKKAYRISGGIMVIHSKNTSDLQLTTDDKIAFQESVNEFKQDVTEIADFNKLNLYPTNVEWSGKITELDIEFFFSVAETNGVYINGTMIKLDDEFTEISNKLKMYYEKFKTKWSKIISTRKKVSES